MVDIGTTALSVGAVLKEKNQTVAVAESSSGGLISAALLAVPGASSYFKGGGVAYTSQSKTILVEISEEDMQANRDQRAVGRIEHLVRRGGTKQLVAEVLARAVNGGDLRVL